MRIMINGRCLEGKRTGVGRYLSNIIRIWSENNKNNDYDIYFRDGLSSDAFLNKYNHLSSTVFNSARVLLNFVSSTNTYEISFIWWVWVFSLRVR